MHSPTQLLRLSEPTAQQSKSKSTGESLGNDVEKRLMCFMILRDCAVHCWNSSSSALCALLMTSSRLKDLSQTCFRSHYPS